MCLVVCLKVAQLYILYTTTVNCTGNMLAQGVRYYVLTPWLDSAKSYN